MKILLVLLAAPLIGVAFGQAPAAADRAEALAEAARKGDAAAVKKLLDDGADVNAKDTFYNATPLTWAVTPAMGPIFAIKPGASGDITPKTGETKSEFIAWSMNRGGPYIPTPVIYKDLGRLDHHSRREARDGHRGRRAKTVNGLR